MEDYLKTIYDIQEYRGYAGPSEVGKKLGITRQTAYDEFKLLLNLNYLVKIKDGKYSLTEEGKREALIFLRKHRLAEVLLYRGLGIPWERVDEESMGIEHGITNLIARQIEEKYGELSCPHGNPIPSPDGKIEIKKDIKIENCNDGEYTLSRIVFEEEEWLKFLKINNMLPGTKLKIINRKIFINENELKISDEIKNALRFQKIT
ncbi:metal-dependent transcriptional regulator [Caldiplasma sukawensis]